MCQLNESLNVTPGMLLDHKNGYCFQNHPFWISQNLALQIILYKVSFEFVNPLGSEKNKHKILAVYYSLGNLHPYNRSKVNTLQLVLVIIKSYYKMFGQTKVFNPLIQDLKTLKSEGINILNLDNIRDPFYLLQVT